MFTRMLQVVAWLLLLSGVVLVAFGFGYAVSDVPIDQIRRYFPNGTGGAIDQGLWLLLIGLLCGTLAEISAALRALLRD